VIIVCIPAYNAQKTIADVIVRTKKFTDKVFVYDDGSTDNTFEIALALGAHVTRHEKNHGKGYALRQLFEQIKSMEQKPDVVVTLDSDGQHKPENIPRLVQLLTEGYDVVCGVRSKLPLHRKIANKFLDKFSGVSSSQSGFRAYKYHVIKELEITSDGYAVDTELLQQCTEKFKVAYVPIDVVYDKESHRKNLIPHFMEVFNFIFLRRPLLNFGVLGGIGFIIGVLGLVDVVNWWNTYNELALGRLLFAMTILLLGALTFFVGLILHVIKSQGEK